MSASDDERREELRGRLANVIRIVAGMAANPEWSPVGGDTLAEVALGCVLACERVCGIGDTGGDDD